MKFGRLGWRVPVVLIGLAGLLAAYYRLHWPVTSEALTALSAILGDVTIRDGGVTLARIGGALLDVLTVSALFTVAGGLGRAVQTRLMTRAQEDTQGIQAYIDTLLGLGLIAPLALAAAVIGLFTTAVLWGGLLVIALVTYRGLLAWLREMRALLSALRLPRGIARLWALFALIALVGALLIALAPPFGWDGMVYQLVGPQRYLVDERMLPAADNFYLGMPKNGEMLFSIVMSLFGRDTPPALVHFGFGLLALAFVTDMIRRQTDAATGWLACALLLSSFSLWQLFGWPYVDLAVMAYAAASYSLVLRWRAQPDDRLLVVVGALIGLATGYKFTTLYIALGVGLLIAWSAPRRLLRNGLLVALPVLVCLMPWLLRGWLQYGNPVYPILGFGLDWDAERAAAFSRAGAGALSRPDGWYIWLLPLTATIFGTPQAPPTLFATGPFLLTAPLLLPVSWRWLSFDLRRFARALLIMALPMLALWIVLAATSGTGEQTRLAIALLPLSAALGALAFYGLAQMPRKPFDLALLVRVFLIVSVLLAGFELLAHTAATRAPLWLRGNIDTPDYLAHNLGVLQEVMDELRTLPDGSRVRMLWELKTYTCPPNVICLPDAMLDSWAHPLRVGQTEDDIFAAWQAAGDDYVLVLWAQGYAHFTEVDTWHRAENLRFPAALERWMTPIWDDGLGAYSLYTWR